MVYNTVTESNSQTQVCLHLWRTAAAAHATRICRDPSEGASPPAVSLRHFFLRCIKGAPFQVRATASGDKNDPYPMKSKSNSSRGIFFRGLGGSPCESSGAGGPDIKLLHTSRMCLCGGNLK